jgi:hypothetical protein
MVAALIPIVIMVCLGLVLWWASVHEKKRRQKLVEMAQSLGLEISWELASQDNARFQRFDLSRMGRQRDIQMAICADTGETRMVIFDFKYVKGHGKNRVERYFSMVLCTDHRIQAPKLALEPESWTNAIAALVGVRDIDFNEDPEFSSAFHLVATEEDSVRQFMNESRRKALLAHPNIRLEVDGDCVLVTKPHQKLDAENIRVYMSEALAVAQVMIDKAN